MEQRRRRRKRKMKEEKSGRRRKRSDARSRRHHSTACKLSYPAALLPPRSWCLELRKRESRLGRGISTRDLD